MEKIKLYDVMDTFSDYDYTKGQFEALLESYTNRASREIEYELEDFYSDFISCCELLKKEGFSEGNILRNAPQIVEFYNENYLKLKLAILGMINQKEVVLKKPEILALTSQNLYSKVKLFKSEANNFKFLEIIKMADNELNNKFNTTNEQLENTYPLTMTLKKLIISREMAKMSVRARSTSTK